MDDNSKPQPMTDADTTPPPADTAFEPAAPLKDTGGEFSFEADDADDADEGTGAPTGGSSADGTTQDDAAPAAGARQAIKDGAGKLGQQATDKVRAFADQGKARAGGALDQLVQLLTDAAGTVDDKVGEQYGQYARTAAGTVSNLSESIKNKDVEELLDDARGFVRASPAVAIGAAATLGFVVARLIQSGLDGDKARHVADD